MTFYTNYSRSAAASMTTALMENMMPLAVCEWASQGSPLQRFEYFGKIFHSAAIIITFLETLLCPCCYSEKEAISLRRAASGLYSSALTKLHFEVKVLAKHGGNH